jgi:hypothetical protein
MPGQQSGVTPTGGQATSVHFDANNQLVLSGTNQVTLTNGAGFTWKFDALGRLILSAQGNSAGGALQLGNGEAHLYSAGSGIFGIGNGTLALLEINGSNPDSDQALQMGRLRVDSRVTDSVNMSHRDMTSTTQYGVQFGATGFVGINCATASSGALRANNVTKMSWSTTGLGFYATSPVAQGTVTGSRGGATVAVLADLLTKLAATGIVIDGTTA